MKRNLLLLSIASALIVASCIKKDEATDAAGNTSYPQTYTFSGTGDLSAIKTYNENGAISAPNHASTKDSFLTHIDKKFGTPNPSSMTLTSASAITFKENGKDTTLSYSLSGENLQISGLPFKFTLKDNKN